MLVALRRMSLRTDSSIGTSAAGSSAPPPSSTSSEVYNTEYDLSFHKAIATFKHQTVFDVNTRSVSQASLTLTVVPGPHSNTDLRDRLVTSNTPRLPLA